MKQYILVNRTPVLCEDVNLFLVCFGDDRRVAVTEVGDVKVSTVFLGYDHQFGDGPPLVFETMIFGGDLDLETWRYSTWEEAEKGHRKAVKLIRSNQ